LATAASEGLADIQIPHSEGEPLRGQQFYSHSHLILPSATTPRLPPGKADCLIDLVMRILGIYPDLSGFEELLIEGIFQKAAACEFDLDVQSLQEEKAGGLLFL
jgi:hypothetical protein